MNKRIFTIIGIGMAVLLAGPVDSQTEPERGAIAEVEKPELVVQSGHSGQVTAIAFSPIGRVYASGSYDRTVKVWNAADGRLITNFRAPEGVVSLSFSQG